MANVEASRSAGGRRLNRRDFLALENARPRSVSPYYSDMFLEMAEQFNLALKGDASPQEAGGTLQGSLQEIVEAGS